MAGAWSSMLSFEIIRKHVVFRTGWGAVIIAEAVALIAASTVHRVCITTCFLFSAGLLYEVNELSGTTKSKAKRI